MSKGRSAQKSTRCRVEREEPLPPIGGTREEIQRTLVETMNGILSGRIEPRRAYAIGRLCRVQLRLLDYMERMERRKEHEERSKSPRVEKSKEVKGRKAWVN